MTHTMKIALTLLLFVLPLISGATAYGQAPDAGSPVLETNPAVRAALELPRETPAQRLQAILWLIDLGRAEFAKPILEELTNLQLTAEQRAALVAQFGSRDMLRLSRAKELAPAGAQFAESCMAAAASAANDPQRIAALVAQLADPSPEVRQMARADLAAAGQVGVVATLEAAAKETNVERRHAIFAAAKRMDPLVVGPLMAMLETTDAVLRADVATLLADLRVSQALPLLEVDAFAAEQAIAATIASYEGGTPPFPTDETNEVELWYWDDVAKKLTAARYPADEARVLWLARLSRELARVRPEISTYQQRALLLELEAAHLVSATRKSSLIEQLESTGTYEMNDALAAAIASDYPNAAIALSEALAVRREVGVLYSSDAQPAPLANALGHADRRVRFAALGAIMAIDPTAPFPGSSRVPEALAWFAGSEGDQRAVVAMPTIAAASNLAGMLAAHQLDALATNRGRDAVDAARDMADLEMIFVDMNIIVPNVRQVLFELRRLPTTANVPIALLAAEGRLHDAERLASEHVRVFATSRLHSVEMVARIVEELTTLAGREAVPADERAAQAAQARDWIGQLQMNRHGFYALPITSPLLGPRSSLP